MNILICFGTRPEAIKMAPICMELTKRAIPYKLCVTAQHREMLDQVLEFFELEPDYDLDIMQPNQNLNKLSANILFKVDEIFEKENFDLVLVHGDTTTSAIVALAAFHRNIKVAHVEAGLRTYNKQSPFPEELNRQVTGKITDFHFAPTDKAYQNLIKELVHKDQILITGNTVIDALFVTLDKIKNGYFDEYINKLSKTVDFSKKLILVTGHRRESFGKGFENLCKALLKLSEDKNLQVIYPVHLNPNVQDIVFNMLSGVDNIQLISPLNYPSFIWLMNKSSLIISDSGGIQEEAPSLNIPVLVTRETTERDEGIKAGCSFLVGTDTKTIVDKSLKLLQSGKANYAMKNPYGIGKASELIVSFIEKLKL